MDSCEHIQSISTVDGFKSFLPYSPKGEFVLPPDGDEESNSEITSGYVLEYNEVFERMLEFCDGMLVVKRSDVVDEYDYPGEAVVLCRIESGEEDVFNQCVKNTCGVNQLFAHVVMLIKYQRELSSVILDDEKETYINRVDRKVRREENNIDKLVYNDGVESVSVREYTTDYTPVVLEQQ